MSRYQLIDWASEGIEVMVRFASWMKDSFGHGIKSLTLIFLKHIITLKYRKIWQYLLIPVLFWFQMASSSYFMNDDNGWLGLLSTQGNMWQIHDITTLLWHHCIITEYHDITQTTCDVINEILMLRLCDAIKIIYVM